MRVLCGVVWCVAIDQMSVASAPPFLIKSKSKQSWADMTEEEERDTPKPVAVAAAAAAPAPATSLKTAVAMSDATTKAVGFAEKPTKVCVIGACACERVGIGF